MKPVPFPFVLSLLLPIWQCTLSLPTAAAAHAPLPWIMYGSAWKKKATVSLVELALNSGFTALDTANMPKHYDEALVGEGIERVLESGKLDRESLFLQTKFTPDACENQPAAVHPYDTSASIRQQVFQSFNSSLQHLRVNRIDSVLLHAPYKEHRRSLEAFEALVTLRKEGRVRFIGVSNFGLYELKRIVEDASQVPHYVQNRCQHKNDWDGEVRRFCKEKGIVYQGFWLLSGNRHITTHNTTKIIAEREGVSAEAVLLAYIKNHLGIIVLDGTKKVEHMKQDLAAGALELSADDIQRISAVPLGDSQGAGIQANFVNTLGHHLSVYWKNAQTGELVIQGSVAPQESLKISTFDSHVFVARETSTERDVTEWRADVQNGRSQTVFLERTHEDL